MLQAYPSHKAIARLGAKVVNVLAKNIPANKATLLAAGARKLLEATRANPVISAGIEATVTAALASLGESS